jgi:acyl-CoA synthetase (AMP-forming)/AMP-acid ligase II/acetyltransferase-like isoleucine patch superfamily enzyme/acyl carrier protein
MISDNAMIDGKPEMRVYPNSMLHQKSEPQSIYQLLKIQAEKSPKAISIAAPKRSPLTFGGLLSQVEGTVQALRSVGLSRNDRVAIVLPNGPEMAVAFVAVAAGATCAPLNPSYRVNEFEFYMSDLNARALVIASEMDSPAREVARKRNIPVIELKPTMQAEAGIFELMGTDQAVCNRTDFSLPEDTALVLHTSGTTSRPKIVPLTQANICHSSNNIRSTLKLTTDDRCLNIMPLFHIHGLIGAVLSSLTAGASVVCASSFDAKRFFEWLDVTHPTWYTAVPTMHQAILAQAKTHREIIARHPLRFIRSSSAALPERVMAALENTFDAPVIEAYGMTEAAHQMASNPLPPLPRKAGSVGVAAGPEIGIMNEVGQLLSHGAIGEIVIRGANITSGYENNPAANGSAFTSGWFRTGDQGRLDPEGYLFLTGRLKEMINRGGEKIAPKEVDEVLAKHPGVAQAVAFAVPHVTLGEDVAAAVVLKEGVLVTESELLCFAADRLADFKVPSQVLIVDEIPKGPTGKLQRIGLADKLADKLILKKRGNFVAPKTQVEKQLAEIWMGVLNVSEVGVRDSFYALGGDSLSTVVMIAEIEKRLNAKIELVSFLRSPTIETLTKFMQEKDLAQTQGSVVELKVKGSNPIRDSFVFGLRNRILQLMALYAPGFKTVRVWLHRMRGVVIGDNVSIGLSVLIETAYPRLVFVGNNVTIGMRTIVIGHLRDLTSEARSGDEHTVRIEENVYIGPGVIILPNVTIGHGAVVSAGSVVSRSVPPETLVRGNPAEPIAHCGVSLGGGVSYEKFVSHLTPIKGYRPS